MIGIRSPRIFIPGLLGLVLFAACEPAPVAKSPSATPASASWPGKNWEMSTPEQEGLDGEAIVRLDAEFQEGQHGYVDSMLIIRNGRLAFEAYYENDYQAINADLVTGESGPWNYFDFNWHPFYRASELHTLQSSTKSVMSTLVGIAIARGDLPGVNMTLGELLPHRDITDPQKAAITLENILLMRSGFEWEENVSYWDPRNDAIKVESSDDWVAYLLDKPLANEQGTTFNYNSISTQLMSEIVSTATGRSLNDYAEEFLFGPIGIAEYFWKDAPEGFKDVSGGMYLKARDFARFALLFEQNGEWGGQKILPAEWVASSSAPFIADTDTERDWGYGYQWWTYKLGKDGKPFMYGTSGWGGQLALIVPELDLIGVFTGWNVYDGQDYEGADELFYDRIVIPAAEAARATADINK